MRPAGYCGNRRSRCPAAELTRRDKGVSMMASHRPGAAVAIGLAFILPSLGLGSAALAGTGGPLAASGQCAAGARTYSSPGAHVYPDTGNGGYVNVHTGVHLVYDAARNRFLPGNHVDLTDRATQCLLAFSLHF